MLLTYDRKVNLVLWIVLAILPPCFVLPMHFYTQFGLSNSLLVPAALYLGIAGLVFVHRFGTFDTFEFQFKNFAGAWFKKTNAKQTAHEFHLERNRKRQSHPFPYLPFLVYGTVLLVLCIVFAYIIFR